jgi:hypothetical protein
VQPIKSSYSNSSNTCVDSAAGVPEGWRESLFREFPLVSDIGLDEVEHHCEWTLQQDRKRLHAMLAAPQPEGKAPVGEVRFDPRPVDVPASIWIDRDVEWITPLADLPIGTQLYASAPPEAKPPACCGGECTGQCDGNPVLQESAREWSLRTAYKVKLDDGTIVEYCRGNKLNRLTGARKDG